MLGRALSLIVGLSLFGVAQAADTSPFYVQLSTGYAEADTGFQSEEGIGYGVAVGYEFHRQWYLEAGYQQLVDETATNEVTIASQTDSVPQGVKASGAYLALLGKASSAQGTLFYRLGVMSVDVDSHYAVSVDAGCGSAEVSTAILTQCHTSDSELAGMAGLGFDFAITPSWSVRTEYQYLHGEDEFEAHGAVLGVQYRF